MAALNTREAILDATVAVYGREGSRGFSMRAVANEAGITATAIYRHFSGKAALAQALVERARRLLGGYMLEGTTGQNTQERLRSCATSYIRFVVDHPQLYRLLFVAPLDDVLPDVHALQAGADLPFHFVVDRIREAMDDGFLVRRDPAEVGLSVWAVVHGLCALTIAGRIPADELQGLCEMALSDLYEGLKRRDSHA